MIRIRQLKLLVDDYLDEDIKKRCAKKLGCRLKDIKTINIIKRSVDARNKPIIYYSFVIDLIVKNEKYILRKNAYKGDILYVDDDVDKYKFTPVGVKKMSFSPVIVGMGPAGLIAGYMLAKYGYKPLIIERGNDVDTRVKKIEDFWNNNKLDETSNIQFGEGGAGTFSDGKLNTRIKDKNNYQSMVFDIFIENGAPKEIKYVNDPHIGTDNLRRVVKNIRNKIIDMGGIIKFNTCLTDILIKNNKLVSIVVNNDEKIDCNVLVLAIGHSARDTFRLLYQKKLQMEAKPFAVGLRIIHSQDMININQYGIIKHKYLKQANYKLTHRTKDGRGVYTFCMCPGGYVVNASSEHSRLCVNGMSYYKRDSGCANSAVVVTVDSSDYGTGVFDGIEFQKKLEEKAYNTGHGSIPISLFGDYENSRLSVGFGKVIPSIKGRYTFANVNDILPENINKSIIEAIYEFDKKINGFANSDSVIAGVESRTSSPIRLLRDDNHEANILGIYPCGEGSGYAGGITSSAIDGLITFEKIASKYSR